MARPSSSYWQWSLPLHQLLGIIRLSAAAEKDAASDRSSGTGGIVIKGDSDTPTNQALDSVVEMALQMPAMQALVKELGIDLENESVGVVNGVLAYPNHQ